MKSNRFPDNNKLFRAIEYQEREELKAKISKLEDRLEESDKNKATAKKENVQGTARQIALSFYYMRNSYLIPNQTGTNTIDAEFINFLTGKDKDSIRKCLKDPKKIKRNEITGKATKDLIDDLIIIRSHIEKILFNKGIEKINKDIEILEKDQTSF